MGIRRHSPCADCAAHHPCVHARQLCHATNWCTHATRLRVVRASQCDPARACSQEPAPPCSSSGGPGQGYAPSKRTAGSGDDTPDCELPLALARSSACSVHFAAALKMGCQRWGLGEAPSGAEQQQPPPSIP
jgi:hypothetical protein